MPRAEYRANGAAGPFKGIGGALVNDAGLNGRRERGRRAGPAL